MGLNRKENDFMIKGSISRSENKRLLNDVRQVSKKNRILKNNDQLIEQVLDILDDYHFESRDSRVVFVYEEIQDIYSRERELIWLGQQVLSDSFRGINRYDLQQNLTMYNKKYRGLSYLVNRSIQGVLSYNVLPKTVREEVISILKQCRDNMNKG